MAPGSAGTEAGGRPAPGCAARHHDCRVPVPAVPGAAPRVLLDQVVIGRLLAEGGEGRVFEVVRAGGPAGMGSAGAGRAGTAGAALVYKELRSVRPVDELVAVVALPRQLAAARPEMAARMAEASAWPLAVVVRESSDEQAAGVLMPRAPDRFNAVHRDGSVRLAGLSYLTSDPDRVALAFGVDVPPPGAAERVALVHRLAMLLEAWQETAPTGAVAHGDLSAKNVLWSLAPAPAVYVIDCDGAVLEGSAPRPRATTPNWEDPATGPVGRAGAAADRYSLGLVFLRLVGAANFPLQSRQRAVENVVVDLELPRSWRRLPDMPGLWQLCERSLSVVGAADRPAPSEWVGALAELLEALGAPHLVVPRAPAVPDAPAVPLRCLLGRPAGGTVPDVSVRLLLRHRAPSTWQLISPVRADAAEVGGGVAGLAAAAGVPAAPAMFGLPAGASPRQFTRAALVSWWAAHRIVGRLLRRPGRRAHGARRLAGIVALDLSAGCAVLFLAGMIVSPWIGL